MMTQACCNDVKSIEIPIRRIYYYPNEMKKRRFSKRLAALSLLHRDKKRKTEEGKDEISLSPDEILVSILSLLTIKEAVRCSILSQRWRYLWTFFNGKLEIDYRRTYGGSKVVGIVSKLLKSHNCGSVFDQLIIRFPGKCIYSSEIDSWVDFASEKCLHRFELDFDRSCLDYEESETYRFPGIDRILSKHGGRRGWFSSLTSLCFADVNVTGDVLEHFLATCSLIKQLVVIHSYSLKFLEVSGGEALRLESLEVEGCIYLRILKISAGNLVSLTYDGSSKSLVLTNAPRLSKLAISGKICKSLNDMSFGFIQHLECLKMELPPKVCKRLLLNPPRLPEMSHLNHLALHIEETYGGTLLYYTSFIEACPSLSRFTVQYSCKKVIPAEVVAPVTKHECLKVVELVGFMGQETDFELAFHLLKIAVSLDKLIIVPGLFFAKDSRERVMNQLRVRLPTSADLVML